MSDSDYLNHSLISAVAAGHTPTELDLIRIGSDIHFQEETPLRVAA